MAPTGDPTGWFETDLAAIEERIARERSSADETTLIDPAADISERRYRHLVENCLGLICTHDSRGTVLSVNPAAAESLGYAPHEGTGRNLREFLSPGTRRLFDAYLERIAREGRASGVMRVVRKDGTERLWLYRNVLWAEPDRTPFVLGHAIDVTDRVAAELALKRSQEALRAAHDELEAKVRERTAELLHANRALVAETEQRQRLEAQLREAQKLEATGRLAGGVAHAFNNLLTVIAGGCELVRSELATDAGRAMVDDMMRAAGRGAALTRQLLALGARQLLHHDALDLTAIVAGLEPRIRQAVGPRINLVLSLDPALPPFAGDRAQIEHAVLHLVANARDAITDGGLVTIATFASLPPPPDGEATRPRLGPAIAISDTGRGMDAETRAHLFEPFFTTKQSEGGIGLSLPTVYGIVHQHGGTVTVASGLGRGTTFTIVLPPAPPGAVVPGPEARPAAHRPAATETILVVDDEDQVRRLMRATLERQGYTVLAAASGLDALRVVDQYEGALHLLLTDVIMPGMNGRELFERASARRPNLKVLFVSGYTGDTFGEGSGLDRAFLSKPFQLGALLKKVREILNS